MKEIEEIKFESSKKIKFKYQGLKIFVYFRRIGRFLVFYDFICKQPKLPEIRDDECRPIGVRIPITELYLAIATELAGSSEIIDVPILKENKAVFLLK